MGVFDVCVVIFQQVSSPVSRSPKNIPLRGAGVWKEKTEVGGERGWWFKWFSEVVNGLR